MSIIKPKRRDKPVKKAILIIFCTVTMVTLTVSCGKNKLSDNINMATPTPSPIASTAKTSTPTPKTSATRAPNTMPKVKSKSQTPTATPVSEKNIDKDAVHMANAGTWYGYDPADLDPESPSSNPHVQTKFVIMPTSSTTASVAAENYNNVYPFDSLTSLTFESEGNAYSNAFTWNGHNVKFKVDFEAKRMSVVDAGTGESSYLQPCSIRRENLE